MSCKLLKRKKCCSILFKVYYAESLVFVFEFNIDDWFA